MIRAQALVRELLGQQFPTVKVYAETVSTITYPAIIYATSSDGQQANRGGAWWVTVELQILATADVVGSLAEQVYDAVRAWKRRVTPQGVIVRVEDVAIPTPVPSDATGKTIKQLAGSWRLLVRTDS